MKFKEVLTLDWYDDIITAFCKSSEDLIYYCNLLAMDKEKGDKIYVCMELKYFVQSTTLNRLIETNSFLNNEDILLKALNMITLTNESFLIKTSDLRSNNLKVIQYKRDFNWNHNFFSIDYPDALKISAQLDNWWAYF
ncbi:hypothetical protein [Pedobacter nutrimenti]|uniref:Uncharacterized protein n=1 Tax=Pedobacter nutrimenti TaxID=1241337 RepID=A0A318UR77_9SPHI|nr:hypothetical protein [Pedobacter nutrimenti]PYF74069.1 hypothetical protein B0O44_104240 [Pedobacter nutrimenti]